MKRKQTKIIQRTDRQREERQKDRKTEIQKDRKTERQKDRKTERHKRQTFLVIRKLAKKVIVSMECS